MKKLKLELLIIAFLGFLIQSPLNAQNCTSVSFCAEQTGTNCGCANTNCGCTSGSGNCSGVQTVMHTCTIPANHTMTFTIATDQCAGTTSGLDSGDWLEYTSDASGTLTRIDGGGNLLVNVSHSITTGATPLTFKINLRANRKDECIDFVVSSLVLPLDILSVNVEEEGEDLLISMETNESNVERIALEYSRDALNWNEIEEIEGHNTFSGKHLFRHENVRSKHNYYRVRNYDFDGSEGTSQVIYHQKAIKEIVVRKQTSNSFLVEFPSDDDYEVQIFDGAGRLVSNISGKGEQIIFDPQGVKGLYLVNVLQSGNQYTTKVFN